MDAEKMKKQKQKQKQKQPKRHKGDEEEEEDPWREYEEFARRTAASAGAMVRDAFAQRNKAVQTKMGPADLVTETDQAVEAFIRAQLVATYPTHRFIGEESVAGGAHCELTEAPTWIVDPVDGTTNFVHAHPCVAISIGLCVGGVPVVGVVHNPMTNEMFHARKGKGAYLNDDQRLSVSTETSLARALVAAEFGSDRSEDAVSAKVRNMHHLVKNGVMGIRCLGSAAMNMCYVAASRCDAYFEYGLHCWDIAAGTVIVREAGGVVTNPNSSEFDLMARSVLCSGTDELRTAIGGLLTPIPYTRD